ncbi:hypothetical protein SmJEL517_g01250 [Synchytrium microbalum]|uniref:Uncharacterized protein n=1 Tax=Synchytrium microbalum TaxID=1806994 RepID=A0A507CEY5_9FUNG|nr:uncharacterized protein SmJEL517_g01250 [Synchytrium microbalum]TPX36586.1 hypothetical protein SmJEL517_g01250 [Synchytrium microbalum]
MLARENREGAIDSASPSPQKKPKAARKSVAAVILASGTAASVGLSSFFGALRQKEQPNASSSASITSSQTRTSRFGTSSSRRDRRAQSLYVLPDHRDGLAASIESSQPRKPPRNRFSFDLGALGRPSTSATISSEESTTSSRNSKDGHRTSIPLGFRKRATTLVGAKPPLAPKAGSTVSFGPSTAINTSNSHQAPSSSSGGSSSAHSLPSRSNSIHNRLSATGGLPRLPMSSTTRETDPTIFEQPLLTELRVGSAPSAIIHSTPILDALMADEDDETYVSSSVRAKARDRRMKELSKLEADYAAESWDEDFDIDVDGGQVLNVPTSVTNSQDTLRIDIANVRKFALHIEDLKFLYAESRQIIDKVTEENRAKVQTLTESYAKDVEHALFLIDLAESAEESDDSITPTDAQRRVLYEILQLDPSTIKRPSTTSRSRRHHTPSSSSTTALANLNAAWSAAAANMTPTTTSNIGGGVAPLVFSTATTTLPTISNSNSAQSLTALSQVAPLIPFSATPKPESQPPSPVIARERSRSSSGWSTPTSGSRTPANRTPGNHTPPELSMNELAMMHFGVEYMPQLLKALGNVKSRMTEYLGEMREASLII